VKLNIGCGLGRLDGYVNVDISPAVDPDIVLDACTPWPWDDGTISEVQAIHVLEHMANLNGFMVEAYRCMADGAELRIVVPHPRHDCFLGDPTHVRPIIEGTLHLYDRALCQQWRDEGYSNTPLALMLGVDFRTVHALAVLEPDWEEIGRREPERLKFAMRHYNNVISQLEFVLRKVGNG